MSEPTGRKLSRRIVKQVSASIPPPKRRTVPTRTELQTRIGETNGSSAPVRFSRRRQNLTPEYPDPLPDAKQFRSSPRGDGGRSEDAAEVEVIAEEPPRRAPRRARAPRAAPVRHQAEGEEQGEEGELGEEGTGEGEGEGEAEVVCEDPRADASYSGPGRLDDTGREFFPVEAVEAGIPVGRFTKLRQLGAAGKEGVTFLVRDQETGEELAMKTFKKSKSGSRVRLEAMRQAEAAAVGAAPAVIGYNTSANVIVMRACRETANGILRAGPMAEADQRAILDVLRLLDGSRLLHNDLSSANFMRDARGVWYVIDFGMVSTFEGVVKSKAPGWDAAGGPSNASPEHVAIMLLLWKRISKLPEKVAAERLGWLCEYASKQTKFAVPGHPLPVVLPAWLQKQLQAEKGKGKGKVRK